MEKTTIDQIRPGACPGPYLSMLDKISRVHVKSLCPLLYVRVAPALKAKALSRVGLILSDAVGIILTRIAKEKGLPAELTCTEEHDRWFKAKVQAALEDTTTRRS